MELAIFKQYDLTRTPNKIGCSGYETIFEPVVTATRKQSILETQNTAIDESCRFVVNIERLGLAIFAQRPTVSILYRHIFKADFITVAIQYHHRTPSGRRYNSACRSKLIDIGSTTYTTVNIITVIILDIDSGIITGISFYRDIALIAQVNNLLIDTIIHPESLGCIQIDPCGTEVDGTLQSIKVGIGVCMTDLHLIVRSGHDWRRLGFECPCTTIYSLEVCLLHSGLFDGYIVFGIILQTLLMRLDDEVVTLHSCRIVVDDTATDGRTRRRDTDNIHPCIQFGNAVHDRLSAFCHIDFVYQFMVAHTIDTDTTTRAKFGCSAFKCYFQFGVRKCLLRAVGRCEGIS